MKTLGELCTAGGISCPEELKKVPVFGITDRVQDVKFGFLFVALKGHRTDGLFLIRQAKENGAVAVLTDRKTEKTTDLPIMLCKNAHFCSTKMLLHYYGHPERKLTLIGITGTKGKTTAAFAVAGILSANGIPAATVGTAGIAFGEEVHPIGNTTPSAFLLIPELSRLCARGCRAAAIEMSSLGLKDERLFGLPIPYAVLTAIGSDHLGDGGHPDFEDYLRSKQKLFTDYGVKTAAFLQNEPFADRLLSGVQNLLPVLVSDLPAASGPRPAHRTDGASDAFIPRSITPYGTWFGFRNHAYFLSLPGAFSLLDCALAVTLCSAAFGIPPEKCLPPLSHLSVPGRMETFVRDGVRYVIDFAHNAMSFTAVAGLCRKRTGRLIAVFGSVGGREFDRRHALCRSAEHLFDLSVLTEDDTGTEPLFSVLSDMIGSFSDKTKVKVVPDRAEAIRYAVSAAKRGDTVLLRGKGSENFQIRAAGKNPVT
ncbi:MAG: UDP-N-acetylmuramyl-tripeptide synthetase, partial [Clostridia bacterium]|nr:UDP-N-acetylmuramyl-tripeptide synthetase [Clostridia bacterium]